MMPMQMQNAVASRAGLEDPTVMTAQPQAVPPMPAPGMLPPRPGLMTGATTMPVQPGMMIGRPMMPPTAGGPMAIPGAPGPGMMPPRPMPPIASEGPGMTGMMPPTVAPGAPGAVPPMPAPGAMPMRPGMGDPMAGRPMMQNALRARMGMFQA